jgi:hypothetical protein
MFYVKLALAVLPALVLGKLFDDKIEAVLEKPIPIAIVLIIGGFVLLFIDRFFKRPKIQKEEKFIQIDRAYTKIPKTYFQEMVWHEYYTKGKTHRQIAKELNISHCLSFVEIKKIKEEVIKKINNF